MNWAEMLRTGQQHQNIIMKIGRMLLYTNQNKNLINSLTTPTQTQQNRKINALTGKLCGN